MKRLVVLISGRGRNLAALMHYCAMGSIPAQIVAVVSNRADAPGLERAQAAGIATAVVDHRAYATREAFDTALMEVIDGFAPDLLALAGFMRILTPAFTEHYQGRALNVHPSLLPAHTGLNTHAAVLAAGSAMHGASVHFVTQALDGGPCILQGALKVAADDTATSLAERVMNTVELKIYPQAVAWLARGALRLVDGDIYLNGALLRAPATMSQLEETFS